MATSKYRIGQRLSLKHHLCTVRYVGPVNGKQGEWLGVEWDDTHRGKNDGHHEGKRYFSCASKAPTSASFLRPNQPWDAPRTLGEAIRDKYMSNDTQSMDDIVYVSGKQAEEVGFSKFARRQAALHGINTLVLDRMRIRGSDLTGLELDVQHITSLDLSSNLFETFVEIVEIWRSFPRLQSLTLDGNRFALGRDLDAKPGSSLHRVDLASTLLPWEEVCAIRERYGQSLRQINVSRNEYTRVSSLPLCDGKLERIDLSENKFTSIADLGQLISLHGLKAIILKHNRISSVHTGTPTPSEDHHTIEIDLSHNDIGSLSFFDDLRISFPQLKHLRTTANPIYLSLTSAEGKQLTSEDGYMLTIARLPSLETLNYSKITEKERLNAETYYLGQIAIELRNGGSTRRDNILRQHPRYRELCEEYDEPTVDLYFEAHQLNPNSLAAKLCTCTFTLSQGTLTNFTPRSWTQAVPKSFTIYALLGLVGKHLRIMPLHLRLTLETTEQDPVGLEGAHGAPEWWDSDDEMENENATSHWKLREVPLVAGTRLLGTYVEGREAKIRVDDLLKQ